jgi:hypothetical protein
MKSRGEANAAALEGEALSDGGVHDWMLRAATTEKNAFAKRFGEKSTPPIRRKEGRKNASVKQASALLSSFRASMAKE